MRAIFPAGNWILERSADGVSFEPWQFYAISDSECLSRYNMAPRVGPPTYKGDTEVICTSYYSRLEPLEHGEVPASDVEDPPPPIPHTCLLYFPPHLSRSSSLRFTPR